MIGTESKMTKYPNICKILQLDTGDMFVGKIEFRTNGRETPIKYLEKTN